MKLSGGRVFQAEETASLKAYKWKYVWHPQH